MQRAIEPDPHHLRDRAGIIRSHVSWLNADHREVQFGQCIEQGSLKKAQADFYPIIGGQVRSDKGRQQNLSLSKLRDNL